MSDYIEVKEAANLLGLTVQTIRNYITSGVIKDFKKLRKGLKFRYLVGKDEILKIKMEFQTEDKNTVSL